MRQNDIYPTVVAVRFPCFWPTRPTDCVLLRRTPTMFQGHATRRNSFPQGYSEKHSKPVPQTPETGDSRVGRFDAWLRGGSTRAGFVHQRFASQRRDVHLPDAKFVSAWEIRTDHFPEHALRGGLQKPVRCCGCSQFGSAGVPWSRPVRHGLFSRCHQSAVRVPDLWSPSLHARSASSPNESFNATDHRVSRK